MKKKYILISAISFFIILIIIPFKSSPQKFEVSGEQFLLDGKPFRIFSGELHYPRIPEEYWKDRLLKAKAMGLNTICTYIFWNQHEPEPGKYDFTGILNIRKFIKMAQETGLYVIIRPGPYICAEWDFGGLPAWLLKNDKIKIRTHDTAFMNPVKRYFKRLAVELADLQITNGGPIIMFQVENEYGCYGKDKEYIRQLTSLYKEVGFDVPFFNADWAYRFFMNAGRVKNSISVANFGNNPEGNFRRLKRLRPHTPQMCGEYWCGWFNGWGDKSWASTDTKRQISELQWMLENGKSFNLYMFHGGTNFGFTSGANDHFLGNYKPFITSYDYNAPLTEGGLPTDKYMAFRNILSRYQPAGMNITDLPVNAALIEIPEFKLTKSAQLFDHLVYNKTISIPVNMEKLGQYYGFIVYQTHIGRTKGKKLHINGLHDYAQVYLDDSYIGKADRRLNENAVQLPGTDKDNLCLKIFVAAEGRVNFGRKTTDMKGISGSVKLACKKLKNWEVYNVPMDSAFINHLVYLESIKPGFPAFYKGSFILEKTGDTYLNVGNWTKGVVWINGHNLGRYWNIGPQKRLYIPAPWLIKGKNELIIFELSGTGNATAKGEIMMK